MKLECSKDKLRGAVALAERITGKNLSLPILSTILLEAQKGALVLKATNLDLGIEIVVPAKIKSSGTVSVSGTMLNNFLGSFQKEEVLKLEKVENNLSIHSKNNAALFRLYPNDDFPKIPRVQEEEEFSINAQVFINGLRSVWYAAATSDIKPEIASVLMYPNEKSIVFVATDSFRLAEKKIRTKEATTFSPTLLPHRNVSEIMRVFEGAVGAELGIKISKNQISFETNETYLASRTTDGVFPDYKQIITSEYKTEAVVPRGDLAQALKMSTIFLDRLNQTTLKIFVDDSLIEIETKNQDFGEGVSKIDAKLAGDDLETTVNHRYLSESLQSIEEGGVLIHANGIGKPISVSGVGNDSFLYLIMPMTR